uniref:Uncharacterized protein n=1 Tax=Arundo donax TaxID=35708 RepID=A0A0A8XNM9_ARUDO
MASPAPDGPSPTSPRSKNLWFPRRASSSYSSLVCRMSVNPRWISMKTLRGSTGYMSQASSTYHCRLSYPSRSERLMIHPRVLF